MSCRLATERDLPTILEITHDSVKLMNADGNFQWNDTYPLEKDFKQDISDSTLWVCEVDGTVAGFAALTVDQPDDYKNVGWDIAEECIVPHRLAVSPNFRGKGVAQSLMKQAEELVPQRGFKQVRVDTNSINVGMNAVFVKLGYQFAGTTTLTGKPSHMIFNCYNKQIVN